MIPAKIVIRPADKRDAQAIREMTADTWDGWDYVPLLLDTWLTETGLFVAEQQGQVVGITKTTTLSPGELWLEGIRTKRAFRGQGIGRRLAFYQLAEALKQKPEVIRLSTAEVNVESIRIIEKMGFSLIHTFTYLEYHNPEKTPSNPHISKIEDAHVLSRALTRSPFMAASKGLIPSSWIFRQPSLEMLSSMVASDECFIHRGGETISGILLLLPHRYEPKQIELSLIDAGNEKILHTLFQYAIHRAAEKRKSEIGFFCPSCWLEEQAKEAGFFFPYDFKKVHVYELIP